MHYEDWYGHVLFQHVEPVHMNNGAWVIPTKLPSMPLSMTEHHWNGREWWGTIIGNNLTTTTTITHHASLYVRCYPKARMTYSSVSSPFKIVSQMLYL